MFASEVREKMSVECEDFMKEAQALATKVKEMMTHEAFDDPEEYEGQNADTKANIMLAFRHLEDAEARLLKATFAVRTISIKKLDKKMEESEKG